MLHYKGKHLISHQSDINKFYFYAKHLHNAKYHFLINKREGSGLKHSSVSEAFIEHSNDMGDVCNNIEEYNLNKKRNIYIYIYIYK